VSKKNTILKIDRNQFVKKDIDIGLERQEAIETCVIVKDCI